MSGRSWFPTAQFTSQGLVVCAFSFKTNNTSAPAVADFRGCGGLTGASATAGTANSGPSAVASVTWSATGDYLVTLADGYRFIQAWDVSIDDAADSYVARMGTIANEGSGNSTAVTCHILVRNPESSHAATDTTGRRISVILVLKNSGAGA